MKYLIGDFGSCGKIPGDDCAVSRVSAHTVRGAQKLSSIREEEEVEVLLHRCSVHVDSL